MPDDVLKGRVDPIRVAALGLANRIQCRDLAEKRTSLEFSKSETGPEILVYTLGIADSRFLYFWERCRADVESARRAALLVFLLSLVAAAYSAFPIYFLHFNNNIHGGIWSAFWTVKDLLILLGHGWSCSAALYLAASFFERALSKRKICWTYFCSSLKNEMSRA